MQTEENTLQEAVTPTELEQAQQPAEVSTEPGAEQTAEVVEQSQEQQKPKNDWVQRRIDQLTREKHEEKRQREALEARLRELQPTDTTQPGQVLTPDQIRAEAKRLIEQERFDEACNKVFDAGKSDFGGEWDSSLKTFQMLGGASPDFLQAITSMDHGHKVLHALGQDPETAERVLSLPPLRMALELARLEAKVSQSAPTPKPTSKAPPPITPVGGKSAPVEPAEFASTAEYIAWKKRNKG
jgi:hypothetical protein